MKKTWILALIMVAAFAFTACGSGGTPDPTPPPLETPGPNITPPPTNGNNGNDDVPNYPVDPNGNDYPVYPNGNDYPVYPYDNGENGNDNGENGPVEPDEPDAGGPVAPVVASPGGQVARLTYDADWGALHIPFGGFTSGEYTITFSVNHPAQPGDNNYFSVMPMGDLQAFFNREQWMFVDMDTDEDIGSFIITPDVWNEITFTFDGSQADSVGGLALAGMHPRTVGDTFHVSNVVVRNAAGAEVINLNWGAGVGEAAARATQWDSATLDVVAAP